MAAIENPSGKRRLPIPAKKDPFAERWISQASSSSMFGFAFLRTSNYVGREDQHLVWPSTFDFATCKHQPAHMLECPTSGSTLKAVHVISSLHSSWAIKKTHFIHLSVPNIYLLLFSFGTFFGKKTIICSPNLFGFHCWGYAKHITVKASFNLFSYILAQHINVTTYFKAAYLTPTVKVLHLRSHTGIMWNHV